MARLPRLCLPDIPQHIIQRGINHQPCFACEKDFSAYAYWLEASAKEHHVAYMLGYSSEKRPISHYNNQPILDTQ